MEKILICASNCMAMVPITAHIMRGENGDWVCAMALTAAAISSAWYHAIENKWGASGWCRHWARDHWRGSLRNQWIALQLDRVCAVLAALVCLWYAYWPDVFHETLFAYAVVMLSLLSEAMGAVGHPGMYQPVHSMWHWGAFALAYQVSLYR